MKLLLMQTQKCLSDTLDNFKKRGIKKPHCMYVSNLNYILVLVETLFMKTEITVDCYLSQKILLKSDLV